MDRETLDRVRDLLPDFVAGRIDARDRAMVEEALAKDEELRSEADLVRAVADTQPPVPGELAASLKAALANRAGGSGGGGVPETPGSTPPPSRRHLGRGTLWSLSAAATFVIALGTAFLWQRREPAVMEGANGFSVLLEQLPSVLPGDDGLLAGDPTLDGLSDEALRTLLQELGG